MKTMTFKVIAKVVREHEEADDDTALAVRFANELDRHNPAFDRDRFLRDCGMLNGQSPTTPED